MPVSPKTCLGSPAALVIPLLLSAPVVGAELECPLPATTLPGSQTMRSQSVDGPVQIHADRAEARADRSALFSGNVDLRRGDFHLLADELNYDRVENRVDAHGNVRLTDRFGDEFLAPAFRYWLDTETGDGESAQFRLARNHARGEAALVRLRGPGLAELDTARYTTCPPGRDDWMLQANSIELDQRSDTGSARNVVLEFKDVPIFYFPYLTFPLSDQRRSGLLPPRIGHSDKLGFFWGQPYYFNLAPNYDATLTARVMSERGVQLQGEFRYIQPGGKGQAEVEYLPHDSVTGDYRAAALLKAYQGLSPTWGVGTDIRWVSDDRYFTDFRNHFTDTALTHLPRAAELRYQGEVWRMTARAVDFQTIDPTIAPADRPYRELPQVRLAADAPSGLGGLRWQLDSEWTRFDRDTGVTGARLDLYPSLSLPWRAPWGFVVPRVGVRYTGYQLDGAPEDSPHRNLSVASLDSGLIFERPAAWGDRPLTVTLEPRLYYLRIPYKNQDALPLFDTGVPDFSFYHLFRDNRFIGPDRVGDANEAVLALTSRVLDRESGAERLRLSIGQVRYFDDLRVNLPAGTTTPARSDLVAEAQAALDGHWYLRGGLQWNADSRDTTKDSLYLHYRPGPDRIVNLGYRYLRDVQEQVDASFHWPVARQWTAVGRWVYSLPDDRTLHAYASLQYRSCCWAVRAGFKRAVLSDGSTDNAVLFEFELTGLGNIGRALENPLDRGRFLFD